MVHGEGGNEKLGRGEAAPSYGQAGYQSSQTTPEKKVFIIIILFYF